MNNLIGVLLFHKVGVPWNLPFPLAGPNKNRNATTTVKIPIINQTKFPALASVPGLRKILVRLLQPNGHLADSLTGSVEDRISDGGGDGDDWGFSGTGRWQVGSIQQVYVEFG